MFGRSKRKWSHEADVVVVGSGAAGLTAALAAHIEGSSVMILERTSRIGGTTAVSGGGIWIPNNDRMQEVGAIDSRDEALRYCKALTMGHAADELVETFVNSAPQVIRFLERHTELRFTLITAPDYHPETPGGKLGGRSLEPAPFAGAMLKEHRHLLRSPSAMSFPATLQEIFETYQAFYRPWEMPQELVASRMQKDLLTMGQALAGGLFAAVLARKIPFLLDMRARTLLQEDGGVAGLLAVKDGQEIAIRARKGVILASAGFEWNPDLCKRFIGGPTLSPNSPPFNEGDGLLMAMQVGADLANMNEVWHYPSVRVEGETYEGRPMTRAIKAERSGPHVIWVNSRGHRFTNEAANYNSVGKTFFAQDPNGPRLRNMPAWAIFDRQYREKYVVGTAMPDDPDPPYVQKADTLRELSEAVGIDPEKLEETVVRWNLFCEQGSDTDFDRGRSAFDRFQGDRRAPHPNLGTIAKPPFYALRLHPGALGTKGGPRTNVHGQVMHVNGRPVPGLYAAGNVAASVAGPSYYGVGSTLGPALTWGYLSGLHASRSHASA